MQQGKKCPTCGHVNPPQELLCFACMADISSVSPAGVPAAGSPVQAKAASPTKEELPKVPADAPCRPEAPPPPEVLKTVRDARSRLQIRFGEIVFTVEDGETIGRFERGKEFLAHVTTVSRQHARFKRTAAGWFVEDLGSTNGTFVNGVRLGPGQPQIVKPGDRINFSSRIEVEIIGGSPE